jgi:hypothetical protein
MGRKKYTDDGDLNAAIAIAKGIPAKAALKHAGYSEYVRRTPKKTLQNQRMQAAFKRLGLALLTENNSEYRHISGILEDRNAAPGLVLETAQQLHDEWVKNGKQETPGFAALPEISRVLLLGSNDSEGQDLSLVPIEKVTPEMVGTKALQLLWSELLDPPSDARSRIQVIAKGLEVGNLIGDRGHLHLHQHNAFSPQVERMLAEKMIAITAEREQAAKESEVIEGELNPLVGELRPSHLGRRTSDHEAIPR